MSTKKKINKITIQNEFSISRKGDDKFIIEFLSQNRFFIVDSNTIKLIKLWKESNCLDTSINTLFNKSNTEKHLVEFKMSPLYKAFSEKDNTRDSSLQNYLKLKTIIFNQNSTLVVARILKHLINPVACIIFTLAFLIILFINLFIVPNYGDIFLPPNTFWFVIYLLVLIIFHEFGHVSALYKFTKKSSSIGFGIYLIRPVLFADVTKAWSLNKYQRIIINISGIYFEFVFLIIASTVFLINSISINNLITLFFIRCLYNLNPFFRTDGYWIVSDYFNIPNLRLKSNTDIKKFLSSKRKDYKLNYYLIFYSLVSYLIIFFFISKIIVSNYFKIINFPSELLNITSNEIKINSFIENNFIVILIYFYLLYWIIKRLNKYALSKD